MVEELGGFSSAQREALWLEGKTAIYPMRSRTLREIVEELKAGGLKVDFSSGARYSYSGNLWYDTEKVWGLLSATGEVAFDPIRPYIPDSNDLVTGADKTSLKLQLDLGKGVAEINYDLQLDLHTRFSQDVAERIPGVGAMIGNLATHVALALLHFQTTRQWLYLPDTDARTSTPVTIGYYFYSTNRRPFVVCSRPSGLIISDATDDDGYINLGKTAHVLSLYKARHTYEPLW